MCGAHYKKFRKYGDPLTVVRKRKTCAVEECEGAAYGQGVCSTHYHRLRRLGTPTARLRGEVVNGKRICPACGVDTPVGDYSPGAPYCRGCTAAKMRARRAVRPDPRKPQVAGICDHCGLIYFSDGRRLRFCSIECGAAGKREWDRQNPPAPEKKAATQRRYYERNPEKSWQKSVAYRARKKTATVEAVSRQRVLLRDGFVCQLCDESIDPMIKHPDPMSATIDHREPLANGGAHSMANCQAAHLVCNLRKGARAQECAS
jgi:5-methylcytosine-specific restriction endonuclease McrA